MGIDEESQGNSIERFADAIRSKQPHPIGGPVAAGTGLATALELIAPAFKAPFDQVCRIAAPSVVPAVSLTWLWIKTQFEEKSRGRKVEEFFRVFRPELLSAIQSAKENGDEAKAKTLKDLLDKLELDLFQHKAEKYNQIVRQKRK